jgi:hypothetical protein
VSVYVLKNGKVTIAVGAQPKDALLFASSKKTSAQLIREDKAKCKRNYDFMKERFTAAYKR